MDAGRTLGSKGQWNAHAFIAIHDVDEGPVTNALVSGNWEGSTSGSGSCTTDASGACSVSAINIKGGRVTFTVTNVELASMIYISTANHDADGDSDGTTLSIAKSGG